MFDVQQKQNSKWQKSVNMNDEEKDAMSICRGTGLVASG
jgi:hypothetical protein